MDSVAERLKILQKMPLEERVERLERLAEDNWHLMMEAVDKALEDFTSTGPSEEEVVAKEPLPQISDRSSFIAYVSLVARKQHAGQLTGKEAGALLYAAQLVYAALKGGEVMDSHLTPLCRNCHEPCKSLFCCLDCAEERYSLVAEALESLEFTCRRVLGLTPKGKAA